MWRLMGPLTAACFVVFLSVLPARAQSAEDMLQACEALEQGMRVVGGHPYLPRPPDVQQCWGFMEAVQQYATLADQDGKTLLDACPNPANVLMHGKESIKETQLVHSRRS